MSFASLLDIITQACDEMSLNRPTAVAASSDMQVRQLYALANKSGRELVRAHQWGNLLNLATITTADQVSDYAVPSDFDRLVQSTEWDQTNHWRLMGPDTPQVADWRTYSNLAQASVRRAIRLIGNRYIRVFPTPSVAGSGDVVGYDSGTEVGYDADTAVGVDSSSSGSGADTLVYEYVSKNWAVSQSGTAQSQFLADTDTSLYDPELMVMAVKFRFMSAKGMDASAYFAEYNNRLKTCIAADIGGPTLSANQKLTEQFLNFFNIPEAGYGS
jgi:hypothetical protein